MRALITGITGQDGHHLAKLLQDLDYEVFGLINGQRNSGEESISEKFPKIKLLQGDLTDFSSLISVLNKVRPQEIYNLGAISYVGLSFKQPEMTADVTGLGFLRLLEAVRQSGQESTAKIYQASSSEMFGKVIESPQKETTPFYPRSPYGVAKTFAHYTGVNYREAYGMHISCGILFNHEGEYRGKEFVTRKITHGFASIAKGRIKKFSLGNLDAKRDWGYAGDYVVAMHKMLQSQNGDDFVIATGKSHSVREFAEVALKCSGLKGNIEDYIEFDNSMIRPSEVDLLVGDSTKAKTKLGWTPTVDFEGLVELMIKNDLLLLN